MLSKSMRVVDEETRNQVCTAAVESDVSKVFFLLFIRALFIINGGKLETQLPLRRSLHPIRES